MAVACAKEKLMGKTPKLSDRRQARPHYMYDPGDHSIIYLTDIFDVKQRAKDR